MIISPQTQSNLTKIDNSLSGYRASIGGLNKDHPRLMQAVLNEDVLSVKKFIEDKEDVNGLSNDGAVFLYAGDYSPLLAAVVKGNEEIVQLLLNADANPNLGSYYSKNAIEWANEYGDKKIIYLLSEAQKERSHKTRNFVMGCFEVLLGASIFFSASHCKELHADYSSYSILPWKNNFNIAKVSTSVSEVALLVLGSELFFTGLSDLKWISR